MACGCGAKQTSMTSNVAQAIIEEQQRQTAEEQRIAMQESAQSAIANAGGGR